MLQQAARLYRIPGTTQAEVCERLGVSRAELNRAREAYEPEPGSWRRELVLASLTDAGRRERGAWPDADQRATLASYLDFVNKDGSTAASVEILLDELVRDGVLARDEAGWVLLQPYP